MLQKYILNNKGYILASIVLALVVTKACSFDMVLDMQNLAQTTATAVSTAEMLKRETDMLKNQIESMQRIHEYNYNDLAKILVKINDITQQGEAISHTMSDLDKKFSRYYPNYNNSDSLKSYGYKEAYTTWDNTTLQTFNNSLRAIGVTTHDVKNEQIVLNTLKQQSKDEKGMVGLLQISHELAIDTSQHLITLKELVASQSSAQTAYMARKVSKATYEEKSMDNVMQNLHYDYHGDGKGFGKIDFTKGHTG